MGTRPRRSTAAASTPTARCTGTRPACPAAAALRSRARPPTRPRTAGSRSPARPRGSGRRRLRRSTTVKRPTETATSRTASARNRCSTVPDRRAGPRARVASGAEHSVRLRRSHGELGEREVLARHRLTRQVDSRIPYPALPAHPCQQREGRGEPGELGRRRVAHPLAGVLPECQREAELGPHLGPGVDARRQRERHDRAVRTLGSPARCDRCLDRPGVDERVSVILDEVPSSAVVGLVGPGAEHQLADGLVRREHHGFAAGDGAQVVRNVVAQLDHGTLRRRLALDDCGGLLDRGCTARRHRHHRCGATEHASNRPLDHHAIFSRPMDVAGHRVPRRAGCRAARVRSAGLRSARLGDVVGGHQRPVAANPSTQVLALRAGTSSGSTPPARRLAPARRPGPGSPRPGCTPPSPRAARPARAAAPAPAAGSSQ